MPDNDPYLVPLDPATRVHTIAQKANISPDIADDYLKTTQVESGHNINVRNSSKGAMGFGQVMPDRPGGTIRTVGGQQYNLRNPDENITAGLKYFAEGGNDPVSRRLYYFGGPRAKAHYEKTGQIPNISDGNMTAAQYVKATGGQQQPSDPYLVPLKPSDPNLVELSQTTQPAPQPVSQKPARTSSLIPGITQLRQIANPKVRARAKVQPQIQAGGELGQPSEATQTKGFYRGIAEMAGTPTQLLPTDAADYVNEALGKTSTGLMNQVAGLVRPVVATPFNQGRQEIANKINESATQLTRGNQAIDKEANRGVISQTVQDVAGGAGASAPAMALTALGVPAPVAFGLQSYLEAHGRDADLKDVLKETGLGAASGALFEIPLPARMNLLSQIGAKLGIVGGGSYALNKIAGMPESEARKNAAVMALFGAMGAKGKGEVPSESLTQAPDFESRLAQREGSPYLQPQDVARRIALREQGTVPPATLPEVPDAVRNMTSQPIGPRRLPTPRGTERPVVPSENLSEQIGVGIQPDTGDIAVANAKITALQRRIQETQAVKQPSPRITAMQERLQQQLADATHERNLLLDPKLQAQLENKPIRQVFAERKVNAQTEPTRLATGAITEANTPQGRSSVEAGQGETITNMAAQIGQQGTSGDITGRRIQEPQAAESGTQEGNVRSEAPRHVDLQARVKRGPNAGDFRKETKAETEARRAQVSQPAAENQPVIKRVQESAIQGRHYHGTPSGFEDYELPLGRGRAIGPNAFFFSTDPAEAATYATNPRASIRRSGRLPESLTPNIRPVYLDAKNVFDSSKYQATVPSAKVTEILNGLRNATTPELRNSPEFKQAEERLESLAATGGNVRTNDVNTAFHRLNNINGDAMRQALQSAGYDAYKNTVSEVAVFSPSQIIPATDYESAKRQPTTENLQPPQPASESPVAVTSPTPTAETTGIAHRVETQARGSEPVRGESIGAEESVQRGRDLLSKSPDPGRLVAQTVTAFDKTGAVSPESMAIIRAQHEQLAQQANRAFDAGGINSPEFKAAEQARRDFYDNAVKPMQTAWSNTGRAQQGETAIDTGTFYGLYRAFRDTNGREMNPREQLTAKKLSDTSAAADLRVSDTQKRLVDTLNKICPP